MEDQLPLYYLAKKSIPLKKFFRWQLIILITVLGSTYYLWEKFNIDDWPPLEYVNFQSTSKNPNQEKIQYQDLPFQFSLALSQDTQLIYLSMKAKTGNSFYFSNSSSNNQVRLIGEFSDWILWESFYQSLGKHQGFKNDYEFAR